ncbi:MAG: GH3 auxin-responsive promoter family protein [Lachnospiraceae bacterium]|nr:GH3 auxin-responsive promoter family protein [Lachnospiraceae bacterium]
MKKEYKATIITPFHNTDMSLFKKTYESVMSQTIGFENIEWIIVLHNCEKEYIKAVNDILGSYDNVVLKELYNDARSAASPRNYALQFVTSPYLEFLDSDDYISDKTIETCLEAMDKEHSDIVIFRMAYVKENDAVHSLITDTTLWNPLEEKIVLTGDGLRRMELYSSINLTTHPRFFSTEFIRSNNLSFDESITMAEDGYFLICTYSKAKKIVVLPRFIGHFYYVNDKSAVQSVANIPAEALLHFSYGFKKIFDLLIEMKAYYNYVFLAFLAGYIQNAYESHTFQQKDWDKLQEEMRPYAKMVTPPPVNKLFTKTEGEMLYNFVVANILQPHNPNDSSYRDGENALIDVLQENMDTDFAHYYNFDKIKTIEEYRKAVPIYTHEEYDKLIDLDTEVGEKKILTSRKVRAYAYDLNESKDVRAIPVSEDVCREKGQLIISKFVGEVTFLMMEAMPRGVQLNDGAYYDSALGIVVKSGIELYAMNARGVNAELTAPLALLFPTEKVRSEYLHMILALRNTRLTQIYASNTWIVWNFMELLLKYNDILINDIENGTISITKPKESMLFEEISLRNLPDPSRAKELREILSSDNKENLLSKIWPNLKRINARHGGIFELYTNQIKKYSGDIEFERQMLVTPYGLIGEMTAGREGYKLNTSEIFFEFIPFDEHEDATPKRVTELEEGKSYTMVVTNKDGLYRKKTRVVIKVLENSSEGLWFKEVLKPIAREHQVICDGEEFEETLMSCVGEMLYDYFYYFNEKEDRIEVLVEPDDEDCNEDYSELLEKQLCKIPRYKEARESGLNECRVRIIDKGTNKKWRDIRRKELEAPADCFLPIHNIDIELVDVLEKWR